MTSPPITPPRPDRPETAPKPTEQRKAQKFVQHAQKSAHTKNLPQIAGGSKLKVKNPFQENRPLIFARFLNLTPRFVQGFCEVSALAASPLVVLHNLRRANPDCNASVLPQNMPRQALYG